MIHTTNTKPCSCNNKPQGIPPHNHDERYYDKSEIDQIVSGSLNTHNKTVSLDAPSGIPKDGDEWVIYID